MSTAAARTREQAHEMVDAALAEAEEHLAASLSVLAYEAVWRPSVHVGELDAAAHWWAARDPEYREALHHAIDVAFDAIEEGTAA